MNLINMKKMVLGVTLAFMMGVATAGNALVSVTKASFDMNSVGLVTIGIDFKIANISGKDFKKAVFFLTPFNRVGDKLKGEINGHSVRSAQMLGPYKSGQSQRDFGYWELWYNRSISCVEISPTVTLVDFSGRQTHIKMKIIQSNYLFGPSRISKRIKFEKGGCAYKG